MRAWTESQKLENAHKKRKNKMDEKEKTEKGKTKKEKEKITVNVKATSFDDKGATMLDSKENEGSKDFSVELEDCVNTVDESFLEEMVAKIRKEVAYIFFGPPALEFQKYGFSTEASTLEDKHYSATFRFSGKGENCPNGKFKIEASWE